MADVQREDWGALTIRLLGRTEIRHLAREIDFRPRKSFGQNFVHDANTVRRIVSASSVNRHDHVLEVGPGLGSLTLALLDKGARVTAVEIDPLLARQLPITVAEHSHSEINRLTVLNRDILNLSRSEIPDEPTALVANLPYNVAVPALLHLLAEFPSIRTVMVMVQAEVAERLAAEPGGKDYGVPSVKVRYFGNVRRYGMVSPTVFWPIPRVYSGSGTYRPLRDGTVARRRRLSRAGLQPDRHRLRAATQNVAQRLRRMGGFGQRVSQPAARREHRPVATR